ncbi:hypothetical protein [Streptococcus sp.]
MKRKIYYGLSIFFGLGIIGSFSQLKLGMEQFVPNLVTSLLLSGLFLWLAKREEKRSTSEITNKHKSEIKTKNNETQSKNNETQSKKVNKKLNVYEPTHIILKRIFDINENTGDIRLMNKEVINIKEITSYELVQNDNVVSKGGLGAAVAGGLLFGGIGAIVGSQVGAKHTKQRISIFRIKLITTDFNRPVLYVDLLPLGKMYTDTIMYKATLEKADKVLSVLYNLSSDIKV